MSFAISLLLVFVALGTLAWRRYLWAAGAGQDEQADSCPYSLKEVFDDNHLINVRHQQGVQWLDQVFSRTARRYPDFTALQIPHTGESLSYAELDARAEQVAVALAPLLNGPDQVVAVAMSQDNWQIVASHLGILKAGGCLMFLDTSLPDALIDHMLDDAQPVVILTRGQTQFRDWPTLDVLALPTEKTPRQPPRQPPHWLDDPRQRLASIFYTSGTTGRPKGVECHHAGYVNLALSYADYFDLIPGMDATSLTSSMGYDGSISEMYSAWVCGCAVVMLTSEQVRSGPELLPVLREAEVTVLFCPPVLLTTLTTAPERDLAYPLCRFIVPAGEAFPSALVEPWTRGRRQIINTYGPTEASTDTSRQSLRPGEDVTIGSPLANVSYVILEPGGLQPLPHGEAGELCIGGVHVARGYRNLPQQTARVFIEHPEFGRLYRSGDRCRIDIHSQQVHFLGRIDAQLKVRGHRVETQPVEDMLHTQFSEIDAAVLDYQNQELVAFVSAASVADQPQQPLAPAPAQWASRVIARLASQLPAASVPSRIFLVDRFVMKPMSGKIDRECLPRIAALPASQPASQPASTPVSKRAAPSTPEAMAAVAEPQPHQQAVLAICRSVLGASLGWDDAFVDHGGHSIVIAQLAQRLQAAGWTVSVRSLLSDCNTARKVAERATQRSQGSERTDKPADKPKAATDSQRPSRDEAAAAVLSVSGFSIRQMLFLSLLYAPALIGFLALVGYAEIGEFFMTAYLWEFVGVGLLMYLFALALPFASLLWVLLIKRVMGGDIYRNRVTPGTYPKWSRMHLRVWCIGRLEISVLRPLGTIYRSAPLMAYVLRRLGARVGSNLQCAHGVMFSGPLDLLSIDDDVAIQSGAYLHMARWQGQQLHIGPIHLESGSKIGMRAAINGDVRVGRGSWITPFTPILNDVGPQQMCEGAPAVCSARCTALRRTASRCRYKAPAWLLEARNIAMQVLLDFLLFVVPAAVVSWSAVSFIPGSDSDIAGDYFQLTPLHQIIWQMGLYALFTTWVTIMLTSLLVSLFLRLTPASPGLYPSQGLRAALLMYRMKRMNELQQLWTWTITGQYLRALAGVRFTRLGASECDLMFNLVPELASADAQVFWSNGSYTNMLDYGAEHIALSRLDMPRNFFSGNNCVAESGQFPSNFLLGVSSPASGQRFRRQMHARPGEPITVAGNPPVKFASARFETENEAQRLPTLPLFLGRLLLNDVFSIGLLPIANLLVYVLLYTSLERLGVHFLLSAGIALLLAEATLVLGSAGIKKALVGSQWGAAHATPFWSWRHFLYFFAQDCFFAWCKMPLRISAGTLASNPVLRAMGCRVGKRTIVTDPLQASDWNAVSFGDDCVVNGFLQFHTFENMQLKVKRAEIRDRSAVNFGATVMGGAHIQADTTLLPLSLVLKEMHLPGAVYEGSPVQPVDDDRQRTLEAAAAARSGGKQSS